MSNLRSRGAGHSECKLFVAGLPKMSNPELILPFFSQFGPVRLGQAKSQAEEQHRRSKGHCVLICSSPVLAQKIAGIRNFQVGNRTLTALPFKSGLQLIMENSKLNSARIIIKKIPKTYSQEEIRNLLEQRHGPLRTLFKFEPDQTKLSSDPAMDRLYRRYDSYSAIFEDHSAAKELIEMGSFILGCGRVATIEKFRLRKKKLAQGADFPEGNTMGRPIGTQSTGIHLPNTADQNEALKSRQTLHSFSLLSNEMHHYKPSRRSYHHQRHDRTRSKDNLRRNHHHTNVRFNKISRLLLQRQRLAI